MANRTVKEAKNVHGTNPQYLIEKIIRSRIYDSKYWKEQCFALTAELLVDKAMELRFIGGVYGGNIKPTQFLCLTLKMLQIQPEKDIVVEFIKNEEFKYVRALGAFYLRLTGAAVDCYKYLEPLYIDNRKLRRQNRSGKFEIVYMDEFIDELLRSDRVCDIILPRMQKRSILEENNEIEPKVYVIDEDLNYLDMGSDEEETNVENERKVEKKNEKKINKDSSSTHELSKRKKRNERSQTRSSSSEIERKNPRKRNYSDELEEYSRHREREKHRERGRERDVEHSRESGSHRNEYSRQDEHHSGRSDFYDDRRKEYRETRHDRDKDRKRYRERERERERHRERPRHY